MSNRKDFTILCVSSYFKGSEFIEECKRQGAKVYLLTTEALRDKPWPWDSIDNTFYIPGGAENWEMDKIYEGIGGLMKSERIDNIVALDDFDVEKIAHLREEFRFDGLGETRARFFRDKLAMRMKAQKEGIPIPAFTPVFNDAEIGQFIEKVEAPWVLKPRSSAASYGIKKVKSADELWGLINDGGLADRQSAYVLEQFRPGDVYHVDSIIYGGEVVFARVHRYMNTPMEVSHGGGVFRSQNVPYGSEDETLLLEKNANLLKTFGLEWGTSHTEFIKSHETGEFLFLETAARVGGANIMDMLEASCGFNLWNEWAKMETLRDDEQYQLPEPERMYSGIIVSLARQEWPDTSAYTDPEIAWRMKKEYHVGLVVRADSHERVTELLESYATRFFEDFHATAEMDDKAPRD
jgi:biotin carboxylase